MKNIKLIFFDKKVEDIKFIINQIINEENNLDTYVAGTNEKVFDVMSKDEINAVLLNKNFKIPYIKIELPVYNTTEEIPQKSYKQPKKQLYKERKIEKVVYEELSLIGYNFKLKGTKYLFETLIYIYKSGKIELVDNLEKNVYKYIAQQNNTTLDNIKTNIIKATRNVYINQDKKYYTIIFALI